MPERKKGSSEEQRARPRERRVQFSLVTFAAWTEEASGEHYITPQSDYVSGSTSGMYGEDGRQRALRDLAEGGYAIDLRPLAEHPQLTAWVFRAPMPNGKIEGKDIDRLSDKVRRTAGEMAGVYGLSGAYEDLAILAFAKAGEPLDGSAGPFDKVSASYLAQYWGSRGARVGRRMGDTIYWVQGEQQTIEPITPPPAPPTGRRS